MYIIRRTLYILGTSFRSCGLFLSKALDFRSYLRRVSVNGFVFFAPQKEVIQEIPKGSFGHSDGE